MKYVAFILSIIVLFGCASSRHTIKKSTATADTVKKARHDSTFTSVDKSVLVRKRDTLITVPAAKVSDTLHAADLLPFYNSAGQKVPHTSTKRNKGLSSTVTIDTAGNLTVDCNQDSMILVITTLTDSITTLNKQLQHNTTASTDKSSYSRSEYTEFFTKVKSWLVSYWWVVLIVVVVLVGGQIFARFKF